MANKPMTTLQIFRTHKLWHFLEEHPCSSGKEATITGMGELKGKWVVPDSDYPEFLDLLNDYLFVKKHRPLGFVEQPRLEGSKPLLIDLDFHYSKSLALERRFSEANIHEFCSRVVEAYEHFFDMSVYTTIRFFVTLRPQPYADTDKIKDGIHILCPDAPLTNDKWNVIRKYLLSRNVIREIFGHTGYQNKDEDAYDNSMGRKQGWMFYGASKPSVPSYKLTNVFEYTPETMLWDEKPTEDYTPRQLLELMSVRYNVDDDINQITESAREEFDLLLNPPATRYEAPSEIVVDQAATVTALNNPTVNALAAVGGKPQGDTELLRKIVMECLSTQQV
jgi:hypothetical protein